MNEEKREHLIDVLRHWFDSVYILLPESEGKAVRIGAHKFDHYETIALPSGFWEMPPNSRVRYALAKLTIEMLDHFYPFAEPEDFTAMRLTVA